MTRLRSTARSSRSSFRTPRTSGPSSTLPIDQLPSEDRAERLELVARDVELEDVVGKDLGERLVDVRLAVGGDRDHGGVVVEVGVEPLLPALEPRELLVGD